MLRRKARWQKYDGRGLVVEMSLVIRNAVVVDGTGAPRFRGDVGVAGNRIVAIGAVHQARSPSANSRIS